MNQARAFDATSALHTLVHIIPAGEVPEGLPPVPRSDDGDLLHLRRCDDGDVDKSVCWFERGGMRVDPTREG